MFGHEKRKKKRKTEEFIQSQVGAMDKFLNRNIDNIIKSLNTDLVDEEVQNEDDQVQENMNEEHENLVDHEQEILGDGKNRNEQYENINKERFSSDLDITDPGNWKTIDQDLIDLLVKRGPPRENVVNFPKDSENRHFSSAFYIRHLSNGEKSDRKWLVYSVSLDKVFCFCCKLFKQEGNNIQLANKGIND